VTKTGLRAGFRATLALAVLVTLLVAPASAESSQMINVEVFRPGARPGDILNTVGADLLKPGSWSAGAFFHFGKNPLVFVDRSASEGRQRMEMIRDQVVLDIIGSYGIHEWIDIGVAIPLFLVNDGDAVGPIEHQPVSSPVLGDIRLSPRVKLLDRGSDENGVAAALELGGILGTGDKNSFVSDGLAFQPAVLLDVVYGAWTIATNVGVTYRETAEFLEDESGNYFLTVGNELFWKASTRVRLLGEKRALLTVRGLELSLMGELHGASSLANPTVENATYIEGLTGIQLGLPDTGLNLQVGGGSGMVSGYGNTKYRIFTAVTYAPPTDRDRDFDGLIDEHDKCPLEAEDFDKFQDDDGCPEPDNDRDKIPDGIDRCPNDAEDVDGFQDVDGCPEPDNDGDEVPDASDKCPNEAEDIDGFEDKDGCPEQDNDQDGINDSADRCPRAPETKNGHQDDDGCPDQTRARIEGKRIIILDKVYFAFRKDEIKPQSYSVLKAVAGILEANPSIKRIRIAGYTDGRGGSQFNQQLSQRRSDAVMKFLKAEGVAQSRLEAVGYGKGQPAVEGGSPAARSKNRRVEFVILD
jgi:outer membrane protein OmpA-like peptidoglycan-associated protein